METCGSCQLENHKWDYPAHVICVGNSGGCALDRMECLSREQFLETDSAWFGDLSVYSRSKKSFIVTQ